MPAYTVEHFHENEGWVIQQECCCRDTACRIASEVGTTGRPARVVNERGAVLFDSTKDLIDAQE